MRFLTIIFGTMASGKTAELLKIVNQLLEHNSRCRPSEVKKFVVFKPVTETRDSDNVITSRSGHRFDNTISINNVDDMVAKINDLKPDIIIIEECQFFENISAAETRRFITIVQNCLAGNRQVVLCGLIQNCYGGKFEILSQLVPEADKVINPHTTCRCGKIATRTQRLQMGYPTPSTDPIIVVDDDTNKNSGFEYEARCNDCWEVPDKAHPNLLLFRKLSDENQNLRQELEKNKTTD